MRIVYVEMCSIYGLRPHSFAVPLPASMQCPHGHGANASHIASAGTLTGGQKPSLASGEMGYPPPRDIWGYDFSFPRISQNDIQSNLP